MKALNDVFVPDERSRLVGSELIQIHKQLDSLRISDAAPKRVAELFDTAKNLSLYSVFVYELHPVAELLGFQALEQAVRTRAQREGLNTKRNPFRKLMDEAVKHHWIIEEKMANRRGIARARIEQKRIFSELKSQFDEGRSTKEILPPTEDEIDAEVSEMRIVETVCSAAVSLRNGLAHGELYLSPQSHRRLEVTAGLINQLFPPKATKGAGVES